MTNKQYPSVQFQNKIAVKLHESFAKVKTEWSIRSGATDEFSATGMYAPRLDVAVGPFNVKEGTMLDTIKTVYHDQAPLMMKDFIASKGLQENTNPRCTLAIEVAYSGSSKHFLGDITNASMMGLYGFVIASTSTLDRLERIFDYSKAIKHVGKAPQDLFSNVCIISDMEFLKLL